MMIFNGSANYSATGYRFVPGCTALVMLVLAGCASSGAARYADQQLDSVLSTIDNPGLCAKAILANTETQTDGLNPADIRVLSWNMQKAQQTDAVYQLGLLSSDIDLVSIQEATLTDEFEQQFPNVPFWSFGPGYVTPKNVTGVMTLSDAEPLTHCVFAVTEPWLRTPKATSVIEYPLQGSATTLLFINVHGVNFTFTAKALAEQLGVLSELVREHTGPVIISGDMNTWSKARVNVLNQFATAHGMESPKFDIDYRKSVFGHPLDHVLVRGIEITDTATYEVDTSDHNALRVELRVKEALL